MDKIEGFKVEISSDYEEFWCYNVMVTCGCFDAAGNRVGFASAEDMISPIGSNLKECPVGYPTKRVVSFETIECHHLQMYIYIIPHTIMLDRVVDEHTPYMLNVRIAQGGRLVKDCQLPVNRWSGASLELRTDDDK